jgi:hypothetical protein
VEVKIVKRLLIDSIATILSRLMRSKLERIVRIEGGLGSQLIGLLTYEAKRIENPKVRSDVSYFMGQKKGMNESGVSIWDWELDKYGHDINVFYAQSKFYDRFLSVINSKSPDKVKRDLRIFNQIPWRQYSRKLPIVDDLYGYLGKFNLTENDDFGVIHIRRGDYLNVASRVVGLEAAIEVFNRLATAAITPIFITSDDVLGDEDLEYCKEHLISRTFIIVEPNTNIHIVHGLMRSASFLVTSNSTFSWTAGMLSVRETPTIISPTSFFGEANHQYDSLFRVKSSWMVLDID